ncbi:helix-turn-helix transcriptional regulator [Polaribacter cellanae]|nr:helix-turn-helix transcriptional regulator [Polaribacter cellanae]
MFYESALKKHRKMSCLTQEALAYDLDIPVSQIGRIERGEINTTISTLLAISKALNKKVEDLFDFDY